MDSRSTHKIEKYTPCSRMIKIACQPKYVLMRKIRGATTRDKNLTTCKGCLEKIKKGE